MTAVGYAGSGGGGSSPVTSVNTQIGDVVLDAADVGADPTGTATTAVAAAVADTTNVHGIVDTTVLATDAEVTTAVGNAVAALVTGPALATDNAVPRYVGASGKIIEDTTVIIGDDGSLIFTGGRSLADFIVGILGQKGYRFKFSGGALNFDAAGASLYVGVFSAVDFAGTERTYLRLESGVTLAHAGGRWEFTDNVEGGSVHALDPITRVAELGAKNSLANVRVTGRRSTPGPPTTDTWVAGDTVQDSFGRWFLCTVGGTPGTWVGAVDVQSSYVVAGDQTLTNVGNTRTVIPGLSGFAIPAQIGDRVIFQPSFMARLLGVNFLDQAVTVAGSPVRYSSSGSATPAVEGDPTAYRESGSTEIRGMGPFTFVAEAGDISGGVITFAIMYHGTGTTSIVYNSANYPFRWMAQNLGPA